MAKEIIHGINTYLTFKIDNRLFGVNIGQVLKIKELSDITEIPNSPEYLKGVINHTGDILPVFDGRLKFGLQEKFFQRATCILILVFELEGRPVSSGLIVDSVEEVLQIDIEKIKAYVDKDGSSQYEYIQGIISINEKPVIILDVEKVFSEEEMNLIKN